MEAIKGESPMKFPATCTIEHDDRQVGEALCPERYNIEKLKKIKRRLGTYFWGALYDQSPTPIAGGIFKRYQWRYWKPRNSIMPPVPVQLEDGSIVEIEAVEIPASFEEQLQSWDCTFKDTKTSDFVAGQVWGREAANKYMLDYRKERLDINGTMAGIRYFSSKWPGAVAKLIEDKANGPAVIQMMHDFVTGMIAVEPRGGKLSRAHAVAPEVESGNIYLPHPSLFIWVDEFINSCAGFPNMAHDDDVDAFTQAILGMSRFGSDELLEDLFRWN
jgi:predicted phage terminase large subunit-like protein